MAIALSRSDRTNTDSTLPEPTPTNRLAYSVEEVAALLGISRTSAYLACQRGDLPSRLIGRRRIVPVAALQSHLAAANGDAA